jgi:hypothetical protein
MQLNIYEVQFQKKKNVLFTLILIGLKPIVEKIIDVIIRFEGIPIVENNN